MKSKYISLIVVIVILTTAIFYYTKNQESQEVDVFISNYEGYVAGYVNDTIVLTVYWLRSYDNFGGVYGVRNLPDCLEVEGIDTSSIDTNSKVRVESISILLRLKKAGKCTLKNAYLEIRQGNFTRKASLGEIEFTILNPSERNLKVIASIEASIGSEPAVPKLMYTILNPLNESVEIVNVTFRVPGLKVLDFEPKEIPPGKTANLTVIIENTSELNELYIIKPLLIYKIGRREEIEEMPLEVFHYAQLPRG
ncbi:hypothetical protein PNA2_1392 [Pyrococcus sp. NA2]|uniref:hypothetical protein n=1 Tax=Pyrococcus sp. (strain NA2) TaxID=342949 RepID=UPI000209AEA5|nr:hypothetical protein [Pyrococcus sp. NA2]AEC52307.1 hypothetical protein PNA2_1392 [Pyrococcus sp. NA2]